MGDNMITSPHKLERFVKSNTVLLCYSLLAFIVVSTGLKIPLIPRTFWTFGFVTMLTLFSLSGEVVSFQQRLQYKILKNVIIGSLCFLIVNWLTSVNQTPDTELLEMNTVFSMFFVISEKSEKTAKARLTLLWDILDNRNSQNLDLIFRDIIKDVDIKVSNPFGPLKERILSYWSTNWKVPAKSFF